MKIAEDSADRVTRDAVRNAMGWLVAGGGLGIGSAALQRLVSGRPSVTVPTQQPLAVEVLSPAEETPAQKRKRLWGLVGRPKPLSWVRPLSELKTATATAPWLDRLATRVHSALTGVEVPAPPPSPPPSLSASRSSGADVSSGGKGLQGRFRSLLNFGGATTPNARLWAIPASLGAGAVGVWGGRKLTGAVFDAMDRRREDREFAAAEDEYLQALRSLHRVKSAESLFDPLLNTAGIGGGIAATTFLTSALVTGALARKFVSGRHEARLLGEALERRRRLAAARRPTPLSLHLSEPPSLQSDVT